LGHVFNGAATITDTVAGNNSCDTIRTLTLAVNPLLTSTQNITICANQLPYTWLGHVFNGAATITGYSCGQQQLRYNKNIDTCRKSAADINTKHHGLCKPVTVYLVGSCVQRGSDDHGYSCGQQQLRYNKNIDTCVNPLLTSTQNITVCANQLPYTWLGHVFNGAATITDTVAGNNSCDTIRTLTLAVNPLLTSTQNITVLCEPVTVYMVGSCVQRGSDDHRYSCGQQQLRYNKNIDTCRKSAADINTKHHGLCKPVTVYLVGSCVQRGSDDHRYSCGQQQLRYNKNIDTCRKSAADINTKHHDLCRASYRIPGWVMCSTVAATITDTVAGNNSCDTIRTLTLAVNPLLTSTQNITVCANQLPYTWLGHVFNGAATITDTVAGNNSCDTIRTLTLAVNPLLTSTQNITICAKPVTVYLAWVMCSTGQRRSLIQLRATTVAIQ
jgi:hypothetical protein